MAIDGIREDDVTTWFRENIPDAAPPFDVTLIAGGHSNMTFKLVDQNGRAWVLRRPPLGHVLKTAHDMTREFRAVSAVGPTSVPVAPVYGLCEDDTVNDAPFYVMGFVDGVVLHDKRIAAELAESERRSIGFDAIDVLARFHELDPDEIGLGTLGKREDYVHRQLHRWNKQWLQSKTREIPAVEDAHRILEERVPEQIGATVVHGDYRLGNMLVADGRVAAVLDWELCTLGDPLADLGYLLNDWISPGETVTVSSGIGPTAAGGFPSRDEIVERYAAATGRDVSGIGYYRAFQYWRSAAILEGVYARYVGGALGSTEGLDLASFANAVAQLAEAAVEHLEEGT